MSRIVPFSLAVFAVSSLCLAANQVVHVKKSGAERVVVTVETSEATPAAKAFNTSLRRNLGMSGTFKIGPNGQIKVTGTPGAGVAATGAGKQVKTAAAFADEKAARMAARAFSDAIVQAHTGRKGFACDRITFVDRKGKDNAELYVCYPDGYDIRQLTRDRRAAVGPRWTPNKREIYYTGFLQQAPLVYRINPDNGQRSLLAQFKGLATGAAVAPDASRYAIVLSHQGNPELYVVTPGANRVDRMTRTPAASEASPCWNANGTKIVYVTDLTRQPQIYLLDVASRKSTRITNTGSQNTNPDWGPDGRIVYASKRAGQNVLVVMDPLKGESTARVVTKPGSWEHPSWAADGRHVVAERDGALFIVDTAPEEERDPPVRLFHNAGHWMNPAWSR